MNDYLSWGRFPKIKQNPEFFYWQEELQNYLKNSADKNTLIPQGLARSYGDVCLNENGSLLVTSGLNKIVNFDQASGLLTAESGLSLEQIIEFAVPRGWFLPVSPGTKYVTLGGAIANDIHGKNHHCAGTIGCHIREFKLLRSDGEIVVCSERKNRELFSASIGGLGLTGIILECTIQLKPILSALIDAEFLQFKGLDHFFEISQNSAEKFEYTVAWLDCVATGENFGRGIFIRGNHSIKSQAVITPDKNGLPLGVPFDFPEWALNPLSIKIFNTLYFHKQTKPFVAKPVGFNSFFYPLDGVQNWNKIYGKRGFFQFQCVVPKTTGESAIKEIFAKVVSCGNASFLAVLKEFGNIESPGMLSFPRPGVTLCLDFPNTAQSVDLLKELELLVCKHAGAMYPAKDALMSRESFRQFFPRWKEFLKFKDPAFSSNLSRRLIEE